jgi:hypothetical protein
MTLITYHSYGGRVKLGFIPRPDFGRNSEGAGKKFRGGAAAYLTTPVES